MTQVFRFSVVYGCLVIWYLKLTLGSVLAPAGLPSGSQTQDKVKIGYWPSYAEQLFPLSALNASLYTHLFFAFADVNSETFEVEIAEGRRKSAMNFSAFVKGQNPYVKTLLSIGGAGASSALFSHMANSTAGRQAFIKSTIALAEFYRFDGVDVDWEFPRSVPDMNNIGLLFAEMRIAVSSKPLLLTAAVYYATAVPSNDIVGVRYKYPVETMASSLDLVNIMCYDYHGKWDVTATGEHTALYDVATNFSSSYGIGTWLDGGLPSHKAVMGLALYGRSWLLNDEADTGVGAAARGAGPAQSYSNETGIYFYFEIEEFVRSQNATVVVDDETGSAYCFAGQVWVGFDNDVTIEKKVSYLLSKEMRGYFFWTASFDNNASHLSSTASRTLDNGPLSAPPPTRGDDGRQTSSGNVLRLSVLLGLVLMILFLF